MSETYAAYRYAADGCAGEVYPAAPILDDGAVLATGTLDECRRAIAEVVTLHQRGVALYAVRGGMQVDARPARPLVDLAPLLWAPDGDVEAYRESDIGGCGGWAIRPA